MVKGSYRVAKKPMLAAKFDGEKINFPVFAQPKVDGIRIMGANGVATTRTLKALPNRFIQAYFTRFKKALEGFDGEIVVKPDGTWNTYRSTMSECMSQDGEPAFIYYVFDLWNVPSPYNVRYRILVDRIGELKDAGGFDNIQLLETYRIDADDRLTVYEQKCLAEGHEGIIIRHPEMPYKHGRATANSGELLKLKRFLDSEAQVTGFEEQMHNDNDATTNALGRTERSSKKDGMVPAGILGALQVRDLNTGKEFKIGTGFDHALREQIFSDKTRYMNEIVKYKYVEVGDYDLPRFPVFVGFRDKIDI